MKCLTLAETCRKIGVSRPELWSHRKQPDFPRAILVTPRNPRFVEDEIDAWLLQRPRAGEDAVHDGGPSPAATGA